MRPKHWKPEGRISFPTPPKSKPFSTTPTSIQTGWRLQECAEAGVTSLNLIRQEIIKYSASVPVQLVLAVGFHEIPSCTIRFYRRRAGEIWLTDDLEGYQTEAILVEDIR